MSLPLHDTARNQGTLMSEEQAQQIIERAKQDKFLVQELEQLRDKCCYFVHDLMHEVNLTLAQQDKRVPALLRGKPEVDSAISLRSAARGREQLARQRRELAEAMVIGALLNSSNPDWDPLDPASGRSSGSLLLALLKSALP
jgi:hypothetical protein